MGKTKTYRSNGQTTTIISKYMKTMKLLMDTLKKVEANSEYGCHLTDNIEWLETYIIEGYDPGAEGMERMNALYKKYNKILKEL